MPQAASSGTPDLEGDGEMAKKLFNVRYQANLIREEAIAPAESADAPVRQPESERQSILTI